MRLRVLLFATLCACSLVAGDQRIQVIDATVPKLMKEYLVPGVSVALVADGKVHCTGVYGVAHVKLGQRVDTTTLFEAASMSKPLFAHTVLKLEEEGQLDLDRPLVDYLSKPYLTNQPAHRKITARMVLTHRSGFPNWRDGGWLGKKPLKLKFEPGARFGYSGEGFLYLQRVVEQLTGQPLDEFMRQGLLKALGMTASSFRWEVENSGRIAAGHDAQGKLKRDDRRYDLPNAAYSLFTTPAEYSQFLIEMMRTERSSKHSLSAAMKARMLEPASEDEKGERSFGLGWAVYPEGRFGHGGSNGSGFRCFSRFEPARGAGIVIMTNGVGGKAFYLALLEQIERPLK
ncbi:MAG: serine hydrolase domain-containing protein [Limisphaerales bacterium]